MIDWCDKCEEMMQPYLDGALSDAEVEQAKHHLEQCSWCANLSVIPILKSMFSTSTSGGTPDGLFVPSVARQMSPLPPRVLETKRGRPAT